MSLEVSVCVLTGGLARAGNIRHFTVRLGFEIGVDDRLAFSL